MKLTDNQINILRKLAAASELKDSPKGCPFRTLKSLWGQGLCSIGTSGESRRCCWTITDAGRKALKEIEISK